MKAKVLFVLSSANDDSGAAYVWKNAIGLMAENDILPIVLLPRDGALVQWFASRGIDTYVTPYFWWAVPIKGRQLTSKERIHRLIRPAEVVATRFAEHKVERICRDHGVDLIYIFDGVIGCGVKTAKKLNLPYVFHLHEFLEEDLEYRLAEPSRALSYLKTANRLVAVSEPVKDSWLQKTHGNYCVIPNGLSDVDYESANKHAILSADRVEIALVGNIVPHKGQMLAVEAAAKLRDVYKIKNFALSFFGKVQDDGYAKCIETRIKDLSLADCVSLKGFSPDVHDRLRSTDIAIVCSQSEAFGLVTIEAMAEGCLVIGADSGATAWLLSNNRGMAFENGSPESLANCIARAISNPGHSRTTASNGLTFAASLTVKEQARRVAEVIKEPLGER